MYLVFIRKTKVNSFVGRIFELKHPKRCELYCAVVVRERRVSFSGGPWPCWWDQLHSCGDTLWFGWTKHGGPSAELTNFHYRQVTIKHKHCRGKCSRIVGKNLRQTDFNKFFPSISIGQESKAYPHYSCVKKNYGAADHFLVVACSKQRHTNRFYFVLLEGTSCSFLSAYVST